MLERVRRPVLQTNRSAKDHSRPDPTCILKAACLDQVEVKKNLKGGRKRKTIYPVELGEE